jgi:hypothetical protein
MNYREAKKIKVGDIVVTCFDKRYRVDDVEHDVASKLIVVKLNNGSKYSHTAIKEIEATDKKPEKYYQVLSFNKADDIDTVCQSHIYPSYVSCMSKKCSLNKPFPCENIIGEGLMLQSGPYDGLKFIDRYNAEKIVEYAKTIFPQKEFEIIEMDARFFGRVRPRWVVNL